MSNPENASEQASKNSSEEKKIEEPSLESPANASQEPDNS